MSTDIRTVADFAELAPFIRSEQSAVWATEMAARSSWEHVASCARYATRIRRSFWRSKLEGVEIGVSSIGRNGFNTRVWWRDGDSEEEDGIVIELDKIARSRHMGGLS
jgi:hypothetical protein